MDNSLSLEMGSPMSKAFSKSVVMPLMNSKQRFIRDTFEEIKGKVRSDCYPTSVKIPFVTKEVLLLSDRQSFLLLSTHGKSCYFSLEGETFSEIVNTSDIVQEEVRNMALETNSKVYLATIYNQLVLVDLKNISVERSWSIGNMRTLYAAPSGVLYYLDHAFYCIKEGNKSMLRTKFDYINEFALYLAVKEDETIAAISTKKNAIYVIDLNSMELLQTLYTENEPSWHKITKKYLIVAHGGNISVWSLETWDFLYLKVGHTQLYTCLDVNQSETVIAAGCKDGSLHLWSLQEEYLLPMKYAGYSVSIEKVQFITDDYLFYFSSEQSRLMFLEIPEFRKEYSKSIFPDGEVKEIHCVDKYLMVNIANNGIYILNNNDLSFKSHLLNSKELIYSISEKLDRINITYNNNEDKHIYACLYSLSTLQYISFDSYIEPDAKWWVSSQTNRAFTDHYLLGFANGTLSIMSVYLSIVRDCKLHESDITAVVCLNSGEFSISGDEGGNVLAYDLNQFCQSGKFKKHKAPVSALNISSTDKFLISGSKDGVIRISDIPSKACLSTIKIFKDAIKQVYISDDFFVVCTVAKELTLWNLHSKTLVASENGVEAFCIRDERFYLAKNGHILSLYNPMTTQHFTVFGSDEDIDQYFKYIYKILKRQQPINNPKFNNWLLLPYRMNAMHFYAYSNLSKHLTVALENNTYFIEDREGRSPLTICVKNKSLLMKQVISFLIMKLERFQGFSRFFDGSLVEITQIGTEHLSDLYSNLFVNLHVKQLPEFCDKSVNLPIMVESDRSYDIQLREFFNPELSKIGKSIYFKQFGLKLCLEIGSRESIELIESFIHSPNPEIFRNEFVSLLLDYKWRLAKWIMMIQGIMYFIYLILLISYVSFSLNTELLYLVFIISLFIMSYEFLQFLGMGFAYFKDPLNLIDLARAISVIVIFISTVTDEIIDEILIFVMIVSLVRGITYFSLFKATRYLTYLINEVLKDILAFIVLLGYSIVAVSAVFTAIDHDGDRGTFFFYLEGAFNMSYGNLDTDDYNTGERVLFVVGSIINMIIMLNLLISILGDTFDRVQQGIIEADRKAVAEMVLEVEKLVFWRRNNNKKKYFSVCLESKVIENVEEVWEGKIRYIATKIHDNQQMIKKTDLNVQAMRKEMRSLTKAVMSSYNTDDLKDIKLLLKEKSKSIELIESPSIAKD